MELKQFEEKLKQYDIDELTSDIIYELCVDFKSLPLSERGDYTWEILNDKFGKFKATGENLRCWVKSYQYKDGTIEENPMVLKQGETPQDLTSDEVEEKFDQKIEELYKAKVKANKATNELRKMWRSDVAKDELKNSLIEAIKQMPAIKFKDASKSKGNKEAVVLISDWHIGSNVELFVNKYNLDIATRRIEKYVNSVLTKCVNNGVKTINVLNLGDSINGFLRATNRIENEFDIVTQIVKAAELIAQFLIKLAEKIPEVSYRSVLDNHGRLTADYHESLREENAMTLIDAIVKERLKNTKICFPDDNLDNSLMFFTLKNGKKCAGVHGDQGSGINSIVQETFGATREFCDYIFVGHLHQEKEKMFQGTRVIMCNSLMGVDQYARSKGFYNDPSQTMVIFDEDGSFDICVTTVGDIQ